MIVRFLEPAEADLNDAVAFYNIQRYGLGFEFAQEVSDTIDRIIEHPEAWTTVSFSSRTRRCMTQRFPYNIVYQIRGETLLVIAVMHQRRKPKIWKPRIPKR